MMHGTSWRKTLFAIGLGLVTAVGVASAQAPAPPPPSTGPAESRPPPPAADGATAEVKVGTGVENREIAGEAASFPAGTKIFVWSRILNAQGSARHVWKRDGQAVWTATLRIGGKRWATSSRRQIASAGAWEVEVQSADGAKLGSVSFTVQ